MSFNVTLCPSGHIFAVDREASILSTGLAAGFYLPYSCRQGACGACAATIREGSVDYGDIGEAHLSASDRARGRVLLCQARALSDLVLDVAEVHGLEGIKAHRVPCRVFAIERVAADVVIIRVRLPMKENMRFVAGQYVEFSNAEGLRRTFSIASPATAEGATELEFHMKLNPAGEFTNHVFNRMKLREILWFDGPLGTFFLRNYQQPIVMCATGTGFAPIRSIILSSFARTQDVPSITLYWGGRTLADLYALDEVQSWVADRPGFSFIPVLADETGDAPIAYRRGFVQTAVMADFADLSTHQVYACGSPAMVESAKSCFTTERGLSPANFFADEFLPASPVAVVAEASNGR